MMRPAPASVIAAALLLAGSDNAVGQALSLPAPNVMRPNTIGPIAKIVTPDQHGYTPDNRFVLGDGGLFQLNPEETVGTDLTAGSNFQYRGPKGVVRTETRPLRLGTTDVIETALGAFLASEAGVYYSPIEDFKDMKHWLTTGNSELVNTNFEFEKYSPLCGDYISTPPVNVSSIAKSSQQDVILAASPDGVFRLKVFDYGQMNITPTFCWSRMSGLDSRAIQRIHYLGTYKAIDIWLMFSPTRVYRVEANPRSRNAHVGISDVTSLFTTLADKSHPLGDIVTSVLFKPDGQPPQAMVIAFEDGICLYDLAFGSSSDFVMDSAVTGGRRILQPPDTGLAGVLYKGYYSLGEKIAMTGDMVITATPTSLKIYSRPKQTTTSVKTDFLASGSGYDDEFITSCAFIYTFGKPVADFIDIGLSTGAVLEYALGDVTTATAGTAISFKRLGNLAASVPLATGKVLTGPKVALSGFEYVQASNPPCVPSKAERQEKEVIDAFKAVVESVSTGNPGPIIEYIANLTAGDLFRKSQFYSEFRQMMTGETGNSACVVVFTLPFSGDLNQKKITPQLLTYDFADSAPTDDSTRFNTTETGEACADHAKGQTCDSKVGWARWFVPYDVNGNPIITVRTKDGQLVSVYALVFKNWSGDRVRAAQINLVVQ